MVLTDVIVTKPIPEEVRVRARIPAGGEAPLALEGVVYESCGLHRP